MLGALALLVGIAAGQTQDDARALLQEIAASSRAAKNWSAEGIREDELTARGMRLLAETRFKIAYEGPSRMMLESGTKETVGGMNANESGTLMVCDGTDHWTRYSPGTSFSRAPVNVSACLPEFGDFSKAAENLVSAHVTGRDRVQFAGAARECQLVRAEYAVPNAPGSSSNAARSLHTMCIDRVLRIVLRDRVESGDADRLSVQTTTYSTYTRDSALPAGLLQFQTMTGSFEDEGPQQDLIVENGVYRPSAQITAPNIVSKIEPSYTEQARQAGVSGIVLVSLQVSADGKPEGLKVVRGLGHGLDEKALEAVGQWRFRPGVKDGTPVAVGPLKVAVQFRLP